MDTLQQRIENRQRKVAVAAGVSTKMDSADSDELREAMADYTDQDVRLKASAALHQWIETEDADLGEGENLADRLLALMIGIADADQDGELDEDEEDVLEFVMEAVWDYLEDKGATTADIDALINDGDSEAAARISELLKGSVGDGDAALDDMHQYAFGEDGVAMDSAAKKRLVRHGKKVRAHKRVSGHVNLTSHQKIAIRKAHKHSHSARAMMRRAQSSHGRRMKKK